MRERNRTLLPEAENQMNKLDIGDKGGIGANFNDCVHL